MKLQFDPDQPFQRAAIDAVVDLFDGQPRSAPDYSVINGGPLRGSVLPLLETVSAAGNRLHIAETRLRDNLRLIQRRNEIDVVDPGAPVESWVITDPADGQERTCPHFSVEMETGTGKTYVYLRTIFELSVKYGFQKFVIVVPSVAIREGVLKNIQVTADHFRALYNNTPFEHFIYDAKRVNRLRQFATSTTLQLLVINIDAFRKNFTGTEEEGKSNVIYVERDTLNGRRPIDFIHGARPVVIIDEPQSVDATPKSQEAIKALNPLCTLRYSATHRDPYNLVYRLDPVRAASLKLVKRIVVAGAEVVGGANDAFVRVESIDYKKGIKAKLRIHVQGSDGPKEKCVSVKQGSDLFVLSNERASYKSGYEITEINAEPGNEFVRFASGRSLRIGEQQGGMRDDIWRAQIKHTVRQHLFKELDVRERGIKVLSLFFIDRVANYREYGPDGAPVPGRFAIELEAALDEAADDSAFKKLEWLHDAPARFHNGYFAADKRGNLKDTRGTTQDDDDVYDLIMKEKERLLSVDEPLRFIFSHSALREGWDNPNVFQICTLNETKSGVKKRQEIGRGLRLPVDQQGCRVFDESVNRLYVMANESYEDFAKALQTEYEDDCGVTFGRVPLSALARLTRVVDDREQPVGEEVANRLKVALVRQGLLDELGVIQEKFQPTRKDFSLDLPRDVRDLTAVVIDLLSSYRIERHVRRASDEGKNRLRKEIVLSPAFATLWDRIKPRTTYSVEFSSDELVRRAASELRSSPKIEPTFIRVSAGRVTITSGGVTTAAHNVAQERPIERPTSLPDILAYLQNETELTRPTLVRIIRESGRLADVFVDPQRFLDLASRVIRHELRRLLVDGIKYERLTGPPSESEWQMVLFNNEELVNYLSALKVEHSVYEYVTYDSEVEREFAQRLDQRDDIQLFVKLPAWFTVETPLGTYNPDWAVLKNDGRAFYLVRETKATRDFLKLRSSEADKVRCGAQHFAALGVDFDVAQTADEV